MHDRRRPRKGARGRRRDDAVWIGGRRAVAEAVRAGLAEELLLARGSQPGALAALEAEARDQGVAVRLATRDELDSISSDHQGAVARVRLPAGLGDADLARLDARPDSVVVVLDGITDPQNLGAAARVAEGAGVDLLVTRERRAAPVTAAAVRASAGALLLLPHATVTNLTRAVQVLRAGGFTVIGLDEGASGTIYDEPCPPGPVALVVGSEGKGISRLVRENCDLLVALPMRGRVESLNASASLAAALFAYVIPSRGGE